MVAQSRDTQPHIQRGYAPLDNLISVVLRRYGEMIPSTVDSETFLMFISFANEIIEEISIHPYWNGSTVPYYEHPSDHRDIPDPIMVAGLLYLYAEQQGSGKLPLYERKYRTLTNTILYRDKYGGSTNQHDLLVLDKDTGDSFRTER